MSRRRPAHREDARERHGGGEAEHGAAARQEPRDNEDGLVAALHGEALLRRALDDVPLVHDHEQR